MQRCRTVAGIVAMCCLALPAVARGNSSPVLGAKRMKINLVAPPTSPIVFKRGLVTLGPPAAPKGATPLPTATAPDTPADVLLQLTLTGAASGGNPVTNAGNHLVLNGQLVLASGSSEPIAVDGEFSINNGSAVLQVPVQLPTFTGSGALEIDSVALSDASGQIFAVGGLMVRKKAPAVKTPNTRHSPQPNAPVTPTAVH